MTDTPLERRGAYRRLRPLWPWMQR